MSAFVLKIIALLSMLIDHMGVVFPEYFGIEFRVVGRIAFPIFVFLVAEGFRHTKSPVKFLARLFVFAIISEPFFDLAFDNDINFLTRTNIFYTLFLGGVAICICELADGIATNAGGTETGRKIRYFFTSAVLISLLLVVAELLTTDYGAYGVIFIFIMYIINKKAAALLPAGEAEEAQAEFISAVAAGALRQRRNSGAEPHLSGGNCGSSFLAEDKTLSIVAMILLCLFQHRQIIFDGLEHGFGIYPTIVWLLVPATLIAVVLVAFYNGKRGPGLKWFFYVAYPVHLAVLVAISVLFVQ